MLGFEEFNITGIWGRSWAQGRMHTNLHVGAAGQYFLYQQMDDNNLIIGRSAIPTVGQY